MSMPEGEKPITKNIRVIDTADNEYEATYPKRAKGLVKNGRARFIDEHTLCLACPPNTHLEDKSMNNEYENRSNGPAPATKAAMEWLNRIDFTSLAEHMESEDIVEMLTSLPKEAFARVDFAEMAEHMASEDIAKMLKALPKEAFARVDFAALAEHMYSEDIVTLVESLSEEQLQRLDIDSLVEHMDSKEIVKLVKRLFR